MTRNIGVITTLATILAILAALGPASGIASGGNGPHAVFAGHSIRVADVSNYQCHDAAFPVIECFETAVERDFDFVSRTEGDDALGAGADILSATSYVTWFDAVNYGGGSFTASLSYSDLSTLGWDNRISSFKSLNGGRPKWWQNTNFTGTSWRWLAGAQVPDVGAGASDQFSSVQNVP
ncbi:MAG: hypothetical protein QFC55_06240 [Chloroflexota bacterium]|nr:hypothetical protein [Chloroflexota bacterium]